MKTQKVIASSLAVVMLASSTLYADRAHIQPQIKSSKKYVKKKNHISKVKPTHKSVSKQIIRRPGSSNFSIKRPHYVVAPHHRPGHRVNRLSNAALHILIGGVVYYYLSGAFYRPYNSGYRVVTAPVGAIIYDLPIGYTTVFINSRHYYVYENVYYEWDRYVNGYRVVNTPIVNVVNTPVTTYSNVRYSPGDIVHHLPNGASAVIIDRTQYYEYSGIYFLPSVREDGIVYIVVNP